MKKIAIILSFIVALMGCSSYKADLKPSEQQQEDSVEKDDSNEQYFLLSEKMNLEEDSETMVGDIDESGKYIVSKPRMYDIEFNDNGLAVVWAKEGVGMINKAYKFVVKPQYRDISDYYEGRALAERGDVDDPEYDVLNEKGEIVFSRKGMGISLMSADKERYREGLIQFFENDKIGYIDKVGNVVIPAKYSSGGGFMDGKAIVTVSFESDSIMIDRKGREIKKKMNWSGAIPHYEEKIYTYFEEGSSLCGLMDSNGEKITEAKWGTIDINSTGFKEGIVSASKSSSYPFQEIEMFINTKGKQVEAPQEIHEYIGNGIFAAVEGSEIELLDKKGNKIVQQKYRDIEWVDEKAKLLSVYDGYKTVILDFKGKVKETPVKCPGFVKLRKVNQLIRAEEAENPQALWYYKMDGEVVWAHDPTIELQNGLKVIQCSLPQKQFTTLYYPQIEGLKNGEVEAKINEALKKQFENYKIVDLYHDFIQLYDAKQKGHLLEISQNRIGSDRFTYIDSCYERIWWGENHYHHGTGNDYQVFYYDLDTGKEYSQKDLFKQDPASQEKLKEITEAESGGICFSWNESKESSTMNYRGLSVLASSGEDRGVIPWRELKDVLKANNPMLNRLFSE